MALGLNRLVGTPQESAEEKKAGEVVKTPEFDITQYAKKLAVSIGVLLAAAIAALQKAEVKEFTDPAVLVGALGLVAAGLLGMCLVMAVDIASRAYLSGEGSAQKKAEEKEEEEKEKAPASQVIPMPPGALVWMKDDDRPLPLLAVAGSGTGSSSYLVASGEVAKAGRDGEEQDAIKGAPKWEAEEKVAATKTAKWRP
jgi:hypothetical protein